MRRLLGHGLILLLLLAVLFAVSAVTAAAEGGRVQGVVWLDKTVDGVMDGEPGVEDVKITLEKKSDSARPAVAGNATTSRTGEFAFGDLEDGEYRLGIQVPKGYIFSYHGKDSAAMPASGRFTYTLYFSVSAGETAVKNIGLTRTECGLAFTAFEDVNMNAGRMSTEPAVRGVRIELIYAFEGQEYLVASASTDKQGEAVISSLTPGTYYARAILPEHFVIGPMGDKINSFYNAFHPKEDFTGFTDPFTLEPRKTMGLGVGLVRTGSLAGSVWHDDNYNGVWDDDETGLAGAAVSLRSDALNLTRSAVSDPDGAYLFEGLQPGEYTLEIALPDGMIFTYPGESNLTEIASVGRLSASVQVDVTAQAGRTGAMPAASLSFAVYEDLNLNGVRDENEPGLPGASVTAVQGGKAVDQRTTDQSGAVRFPALRSGDAEIRLALPDGFLLSPDEGALFEIRGAMQESAFTLTLDKEETPLCSAAATQAAAIRGILFEDPVNTGLYQEGYALLDGFTVQAVEEDGHIAASAETRNGAYTLYPLLPGEYAVRFLLNDPYVASPYAADQAASGSRVREQTPAYGETDAISLNPGQTAENVNGAVFRAGTVDGTVALEGASGGVRGVTVTLVDEDGRPVSDFSYGTTDDAGAFLIKGVLPGVYRLSYTVPENAAFTQPMTDEETVLSEPFTSESGSEIHMPAIAATYTSVLSGSVTADEAASVTVSITSLATGQTREAAVEGSSGSYRFAKLRPGDYSVHVALPEGMVFGYRENGLVSMLPESSADVPLSFLLGDNRLDADLYAARPVSVSGIVFYDADFSGSQEHPAEGRTLFLTAGELSFTQVSDAEGRFIFEQLPPGAYSLSLPLDDNEIIVGVSAAADGAWRLPVEAGSGAGVAVPLMQYASVEGSIWNLDGSLNSVAGIPVVLLCGAGEALEAKETDEGGAFVFTGLLPGDYALSAVLPEGYLFARSQDTASRESYIQSQPDGSFTALPFSVAMGDAMSGMDIGMGAMGQLGDRAWLDTNGNGLQDLNEPDMPGIRIELYQHGELIASAVTDVYGRYLFSDLYPGEYEMRVTMHAELKPTKQNGDFPLLNSILPESGETTVTVPSVVVPSGSHNLHCDLGFALRKANVYPAAMDQIPVKDWRPYSERK